MAHTIKTLSVGDITRKALAILHNNLVFTKTINREYDDRFARSGAKNGGTLLIRDPNEFTIRTGAVMDTQDLTETTQTLTLATQKGVDINFSSVELTLSLDDFADRILEPAMSRLAAEVDKTVIAGCYYMVYNQVLGTALTLANCSTARTRLSQALAPQSNRYAMITANNAAGIVTSGATFLNPSQAISRQYETGAMGDFAGFKFYETEMCNNHTCGTRTDATPTVSTTALAARNGTAYIDMTTNATGTTANQGDIFTIAGVYEVNPETKATLAVQKRFSIITTIAVSSSACTINVSPTVYVSGAKKNCNISTDSATGAVIFATSGATSTTYVQQLFYHRDAFTWVSADLEMPQGVDFARREVFDGISLRLVRQYDIVNDKFPCRIDVLFGQLATRPGWACRVFTTS